MSSDAAVKSAGLILLAVAIAAGVPAHAHHSFSAVYNEDQSVTLEGEVVEFQYRSPHSWVYLTAPDEDGQMQRYGAEWASALRLRQRGIEPGTLRPGDRVIVTGSPARNAAARRIHLKSIVRPADGWSYSGSR